MLVSLWRRSIQSSPCQLDPGLTGALIGISCLICIAPDLSASESKVSFFRDIRPIFQTHCHGCHQPAKQGGDYVMTDFAQLAMGGESEEQAIVAGDPQASFLLAQIKSTDGQAIMPKGKPPLSNVEYELIEKWVAAGAEDDTPMSAQPKYDMDHPPIYAAAPVITSLDHSPDGSLLAVSGYHEVVLHKTDGSGIAARLVGISERIESAVFSSDGKLLAVTGGSPGRMGEVQVWNVPETKLVLSLTVGYDTVYGASLSHDGKLVAFGCPDNTVRAVEVESGKQILFNGAHSDWVLDSVFSVKSDHLVTVSRDMSMKLINVPTQRFIDNITSITPGALKGGLHTVDRHPFKDEVLIGGADGVPKIYKMYRDKARKIGDDFNLIRAFPALPGRLFDVAHNATGNKIVVGSSFNGTGEVRIFNSADGKEVAKTMIPGGGVFAVSFDPNDKSVAAGGFEGKVYIIDASNGAITREFYPIELTNPAVAAAESLTR